MNNYINSYSQYVRHSLNRSPSKTSYTFSKTERFPQKCKQALLLEAIPHSKYHHNETYYYQQHTPKRQISPDRKLQSQRTHMRKGRQYYQEKEVKRDIDKIINHQYKQLSRTPPKSPLIQSVKLQKSAKKITSQQPQANKQKPSIKRQGIAQKNMPSQPKNNLSSSFQQKSISKSKRKLHTHRVYTQTNYLHEINHVSKNRTSRGYYPTGLQISPRGKYPISTIKNLPTYSFGKPIQQSRYLYINKYCNELGPGSYEHYSQFGPVRRK